MIQSTGMPKPELQQMPQIKDRYSFLYLEHCKVSCQDSALKVTDQEGIVLIPSSSVSVILLGPGTTISHKAIELGADCGLSLVWCGEQGVRFYASGRPLTHSSRLLQKQAEMVVNQRSHLQVVRKMYSMRFPGEDVSGLTTQQLRGKEGARVRKEYARQAKQWGVEWTGRKYETEDFFDSTPVNQSLSAGNVCLYGLAHAVICALGCSPGLGFVHVGHEKSMVYDLADLYKAEITIPIAFELASKNVSDIASETRRRVRDEIHSKKLLARMVKDMNYLLSDIENYEDFSSTSSDLYLWDSQYKMVEAGKAYIV